VQTAYAKLDIALKHVRSITMEPDREMAVFEMKNGDRVKGSMIIKTLHLRTAFGKVSIGLEQIAKVEVISGDSLKTGLVKGLVLYYSFDRDEDSKVTDESGKKNNGEVKGAKWTARGKVDGAYEMDGRSSQIGGVRNVGIEGSAPRTLVAWIRCDDIPVEKRAVPVGFGKSNCYADPYCSGTMYAIGIQCVAGTKTIGMWGINQGDVWSATPFSAGQWYHVAATFDGKTVCLYLDGKLDVSKEVSLNTPSSPLAIGRIWGDYPDRSWFVGAVDEVMIFDRALSEDEVRLICDAQM